MTARLVIHIVLDDMGAEQVTHFGRNGPTPGVADTLFLDEVADNGVIFTHCYAEAFCSPSRANHFAGRHTEDHGVGNIIESDAEGPLLQSEITLPEVLKLRYGDDVVTAAVGKWHLGTAAVGGDSAPNLAGFDLFVGTERNITNFYGGTVIRQGERITISQYLPSYFQDAAISWLRRFAADPQGRRGYLYVPFHLPHEPFHRPPLDVYSDSDWPCPQQIPTSQTSSEIVPYFKRMVGAVSVFAQRLWESMPASLQAETVVFITADNGTAPVAAQAETYPDGTAIPGAHVKRSNFDPGIRVPAYAYSPLIASPGREVTGLVQSCDWYATTLELLGVTTWRDLVTAHYPGYGVAASERSISLVKNLTGGSSSTTSREFVHTGIFSPNGFNAGMSPGKRMITDGRHKLIFDGDRYTEPSFYDFAADPTEAAPITSLTPTQSSARTALYARREEYFDEIAATA